ncbi:MAG: hypothetical protein LC778_09205 [Acidobacteria bacterium]|nr:hypothetical protein [Acidobacteriota bacterium]
MFSTKRQTITLILILLSAQIGNACGIAKNIVAVNEPPAIETASPHSWTRVTESAAYPVGYNYPVFVAQNRMWAFHNEGIWHSADAKNWTKANLPFVRRNAYEARYVQFNNAVYAFGQNQGNYVDGIKFSSIVRRTTDFERWEALAEKSNLPDRVFYGSVVFNGKIWLLGGFDGKDYFNDVWNSSDGVRWTKVSERAAWSPRNIGSAVVFKNRIWIIGGGVIDGEPSNNPKSNSEIWSSADGINWTLVTDKSNISALGTPIVFDEKLWLVGANRDGNFARSSLVTNDGVTWREESAPWSPRGAVAAWVFDNKLYITGGKYSVTENGEIKFIYSNDVWFMDASRT